MLPRPSWVQISSPARHSRLSAAYVPPTMSETNFHTKQQTKLYFLYFNLDIFIRIQLEVLSVNSAQNKATLLNTQSLSAGNIP